MGDYDDTLEFEKPLPQPGPDTGPFWEGLHEHKLVLQRCAECGKPRHYPRPMCSHCYSMRSEWFEAAPQGKVHSWTVAHHPFHIGFKRELPYTLVTVDLQAGVRMLVPVAGDASASLAVGQDISIEFEDVSADITLPRGRLHG